MALLFMDGFDAGDTAQKWAVAVASAVSTVTRFGTGRSLSLSGSGNSVTRAITPSAQVTVGYAYASNTASVETSQHLHLSSDGGNTLHLLVGWESATSLAVWRTSTGTKLTSAAVNAPALANGGGWAYIEVQATIDDTAGTVKVRVNGQLVIDFTGDTRNGGTSTLIDAVQFRRSNLQGLFDDVYILNGTGAAPTTFLGEVRVQTVVPTGAGTSAGLTPSSGANWAAVDELPYSATDYVSGSSGTDLYVAGDLPAGPTAIKAVQVNAVAKKADAGDRYAKPLLRTGGTTYNQGLTALGTSDSTAIAPFAVNPNTGVAWTAADVNAMEIGVEVG